MKLDFNREQLGRFCQQRGIARLELFGSALRDGFRSDSDVDLLATLRGDANPPCSIGRTCRRSWPSCLAALWI